jgi:hypothetical protein
MSWIYALSLIQLDELFPHPLSVELQGLTVSDKLALTERKVNFEGFHIKMLF